MGDTSRSGTEQSDTDLAAALARLGTPPARMAAEPVVIPAYGRPRKYRRVPDWLRFLLALPVYFLVLWLVVIPGYPLPVGTKAALGFLLAGGAAGIVVRRGGWLAGLLGFGLVLLLALITVAITLATTGLGPSFLINADTAHGDTSAVGNVRGDLLRELIYIAGGGGLLSVLGGGAGSLLRRRGR
ncbi:MAG TPA: hypothetical protein VIU62_20825 [Chloroflexota bacterium]